MYFNRLIIESSSEQLVLAHHFRRVFISVMVCDRTGRILSERIFDRKVLEISFLQWLLRGHLYSSALENKTNFTELEKADCNPNSEALRPLRVTYQSSQASNSVQYEEQLNFFEHNIHPKFAVSHYHVIIIIVATKFSLKVSSRKFKKVLYPAISKVLTKKDHVSRQATLKC